MPYYHDIKLDDKVFWGTKHKGKKIKEVIEQDPDYIAYCINTITNFHLNADAFRYYWQVLEDHDEDSRPFINAKQFEQVCKRVEAGEYEVIEKCKAHFRLLDTQEIILDTYNDFKVLRK
jgi:hypothetical protein